MPDDGPSRDPRTQPAGRDRRGRGERRPRCRARGDPRRRASRRSSPASAAIFLSDPDRPGLTLAASDGIPEGGLARRRCAGPGASRSPRRSRPGGARSTGRPRRDGGESFVGAYLPADRRAAAASRRCSGRSGSAGRRRTRSPTTDREALEALAVAGGPRRRPGAAGVDRRRALRVVRADGPHRPADRPRQRADRRPDPGARARPGRPAGQRGVARDLRRRRLPRRRTSRAATRPATTSCARSRPSWPSRSGSSTRSGGSAATSSSWSRRARPAAMVARRVLDGIAALPAVGRADVSVSAGVARFPADGTDSESLDRGRDGRAGAGQGRGRRAPSPRPRPSPRQAVAGPRASRRPPSRRDRRRRRRRRARAGLQRERQHDPRLGRQAAALEVGDARLRRPGSRRAAPARRRRR